MNAPGGGFSPAYRRDPWPYIDPRPGCVRQRTTAFGSYRYAGSASALAVICRSALMSETHRLRPCVAITTSPAVGWIANSWTATVGRLLLIFVQRTPRLVEA